MDSKISSPNQQVAEAIVSKLEADGVLLTESMKDLAVKLTAGKMSSSDWITLVGVDVSNRKKHDQNKA